MAFFIVKDIICFLPEIFFGFFSCFSIIFYSLFSTTKPNYVYKTYVIRDVSYWLTLQLFLFTLFLFINNPSYYQTFFFGVLSFDLAIYWGKIFLFFFIFLVFLIASNYLSINKVNSFEFFVLIAFSSFGLLLMLQANDLLSFYLALEMQSLCFYALASFRRDSAFSVEAGLKYFILGAFASGILLYGCSLIYAFTGSTNFSVFTLLFATDFYSTFSITAVVGFIFVLVGFSFKLTAAPFHFWAPDTYEGAPVFVSFFFAVIPKIALFFVFVRFVFLCFYSWAFVWVNFLLIISLFSILIGGLGALIQRKLKRFFVFSSISHVGYILLGISTGTLFGLSSVFVYLFIYVFMVFGVWSFLFCFFKKENTTYVAVKFLEDFRFIFQENPLFCLICVFLLFSMAGIPPLAGFYSKLFVFFSAGINSTMFFFLFIVIFLSIVSSFYYLRFIKIIAFESFIETLVNKGNIKLFTKMDKVQALLLTFCFFFINFFCFSPGLLFIITHRLSLCFIN